MPAELPDPLHYETGTLRAELQASNGRVHRAHNSRPHDMAFIQAQVLLQDWVPPACQDIDNVNLVGQPWWDELRESLSRFESTQHWSAPTKHRAFFSSLRTLLAEIAADDDPASQAARLKAAHTWWAKHRPRGRAGNPAASAALASSLAIPANSLLAQAVTAPATMRPSPAPPSPGPPSPGGLLSLSGTKHEFFAAFTKAAPTAPTGQASQLPHSSSNRFDAQPPSSPTPAHAPAYIPMSRLAAVQPNPSTRSMNGLPRPGIDHKRGTPATIITNHHHLQGAILDPVSTSGQVQGLTTSSSSVGALQAVGPTMAPRTKARVVFDPDHMEAAPGPTPNTQGKAPSWFQGPFRAGAPPSGSKTSNDMYTEHSGPTDSMVRSHYGKSPVEVSLAVLRQQQAAIQDVAVRSAQCVNHEMQAWAARRARLEEEMVRRQESSRYALPSTRHGTEQGMGAQAHDDVSAYAGVTHEVFKSVAAGHQDLSAAPDAMRLVPGLAPVPTTALAAQEERAVAASVFEYEARKIAIRIQQLGIVGTIRPAAMLKALGPVPDKPYLECMAHLPRPGEHLQSRPGSVRGGGGGNGRKASSRRKGEGSSGKRPHSK